MTTSTKQTILLARLEKFLDDIAPRIIEGLNKASSIASNAEQQSYRIESRFGLKLASEKETLTETQAELAGIKSKLRALLTNDQIEAAKLAGMPLEDYAVECIALWQEKIGTKLRLPQDSDLLKEA